MICFDEFGPLEVRPVHGTGWAREGHPQRLPATYHRPHGTRQLLAAYDMKADRLYAHRKRHKRWPVVLAFLRYLRSLYPVEERLYVILDNYATHRRAEVVDYARDNNIELVYTPVNASWLNRIECHFAPLRHFVFKNSNYASHGEMGTAIRRYIAWRNRHPRHPEVMKHQNRAKVV